MLRHNSQLTDYLTVLLLCMILCTSLLPINTEAATKSTRYAIVLASAPGKNLKWEKRESPLLDAHTIFVEQVTIKGSPWERLCLGYFDNRNQAAELQKELQQIYPGAWLQAAPAEETKTAVRSPSATAAIVKPVASINTSSLTEEQLDSLMQRAKSDITNKNYASAIRYLTAIISTGENKYSREALELLGLARQRNNQTAHAVDIYEKYLVRYPEGGDSDRVRQRLAGLLTATSPPRKKIHDSNVAEDINDVALSGSLSQHYLNNTALTDDIGNVTTLSQLVSILDLTVVQRTNNFDQRYQLTADQVHDFVSDTESDEFRFIETYYEVSHRKTGTSGRFGRQLLRLGGIRKRFDGLSAGYQINPDMRINILGGYPVEIDNYTSVNTSKTFYGFTFETGTFLEHWNMNLFYFDQQYEGLTDSNSVGTDLWYRDKTKSLFAMIDYDLFYSEMNIMQFNANMMFDHGRTAYINAFISKTPVLATSNALIGRPENSMEELKNNLNIEQIYQLARDRTADSQTFTVGGSQSFNENLQVTADISIASVDGTEASGGVAATPGTGPDYYFSTQLISNNFFVKNDTNVLGIRYYDTDTSSTISLIANTRFPVTQRWRINPRLQYDIRDLNDGRSQKKLRTLLRTDYHYLKQVRFDFDIGFDDITENHSGPSLASNTLYFNIGYRWDF